MVHVHYGIWENLENSMRLLLGLSVIVNIKNIRNCGHITYSINVSYKDNILPKSDFSSYEEFPTFVSHYSSFNEVSMSNLVSPF